MKRERLIKKNGFTIIEVSVVFLLILGIAFLVIPRTLNDTKQAKLISKWGQTYSETEYTFSAIKAQLEGNVVNPQKDLLAIIRPYFRMTSKVNGGYRHYFMNKQPVMKDTTYHFDSFYLTSTKEILGLKWINQRCESSTVCALVSFDVNGSLPPNMWGIDVFGINVYKDKIEPIGKNVSPDMIKYDCSKKGSGVNCSYYYLIGGKFD